MTMSRKSLGSFIRLKREQLKLSRAGFEESFGVDSGYLGNLEGGYINFSSGILIELAKNLDVRPGLLLDLLADAITFEQAVILDKKPDTESNRRPFLYLPEYFSEADQAFLEEAINFITATYNRGKKKPEDPDWQDGQDRAS